MAEKLGAQTLKTQAAPVTPNLAAPRFEGLDRLSQALTSFSQNVQQVTVSEHNKAAKRNEEKGRIAAAEAISQGRETFAELEDAGILDRGSNPFFRDGVLFMAGKARADNYGASLQVAYAERFGNDPSFDENDFDAFAEEFSATFEQENPGMDDDAVNQGFAERASDYLTSMKQRHAGIVASNIENLGNEALRTMYRGSILDAVANGNPLDRVTDVTAGLERVRQERLAALGPNPKPHEKTAMNKAMAGAIIDAARVGDLTEAEGTEAMKQLAGGTGPLWGVGENAINLQAAAASYAATVLQRDNLNEVTIMRQQQAATREIHNDIWALYDPRSGTLDIEAILADVQIKMAGDTRAFDENIVQDLTTFRDNLVAANRRGMESNQPLLESLQSQVIQGTLTDKKFITDLTGTEGGINPADAWATIQMMDRMKAMKEEGGTNNRMFNAGLDRLKAGLGAFSPDPIIAAAFNTAAPVWTAEYQEWFATNPGEAVSGVKFQEFLTASVERMRAIYLEPGQRELVDSMQRQAVVANKTAHFESITFTSDTNTLLRWLAEDQLELDDEFTGIYISEDQNIFFRADDRQLAEEYMLPDVFEAAVRAQLKRNGINPDDSKIVEQLDNIKAGIIRNEGRRPGTSTVDTAIMGLSSRTDADLLEAMQKAEALRLEIEQSERNEAAALEASQNPNIPIVSDGSPDDED